MANQVVGAGSVEIIFNYERNLKNMLSNVKKEWDKVDISKRLDGIDKSLNKLNKTTNDNTKVTNDNSKAQKSKKDITEILKNNELMLEKVIKNSNKAQRDYIQTLQQQVKAGQPLTSQQKERIRLLADEKRSLNGNAIGYGIASRGLEQLGSSMLNVTKNAILYQAQIEKSLAVTSAVARSGTEGIKVLENAMFNMAKDTPIRFDLISASMYNMASAGLDVTEILETMPTALKMSIGTGEGLNKATDLLVSTIKSFDMEFLDSGKVMDVYASSISKSMATVEKLQTSIARVGATASYANVSFEETTAILSKLYDLGLRGSNAGTVLSNVITRLTSFTNQSQKAIEKAGMSVNDVSLEYNTLGESLAKITLAIKENRINMEQLQHIFGTRGKIITDFLGQLKGDNVDELTKSYDELVKSISDAEGVAESFFEVQEETTQMALDKLGNSVDSFKIAIGEANKKALVPFASGLADIINEVAELSRSSKGMQAFLGILSGGTAVIGKSISVLSSLGLACIALKNIPWGLIATKIGLIKTALFSFNPIAIGVTATITALAGAFYLYTKRKNEALEKDRKLKSGMSELKTVMEQNNGILSANVTLTNDQIEAKKELERYTGTEINNLTTLSKAQAQYNEQLEKSTLLQMAKKSADMATDYYGVKDIIDKKKNSMGGSYFSQKGVIDDYKEVKKIRNFLDKYAKGGASSYDKALGYNAYNNSYEDIKAVEKFIYDINKKDTEDYVNEAKKVEQDRIESYAGGVTPKEKETPKPEDDIKDLKTGFDPISEAQKAVRDKIDEITRTETQKARTSGKLVTEDELNQNINNAIKLAFKNQNIADTIASSAKGELSKDFKDFDWNKFSTAVQNEVYAERVKLFDPEDFNFTDFSKSINDSLQTAKDYENNLNANIKGLKEASELLAKSGDNEELKKQAQNSINSFIEGINKSIPFAESKIDTQKFIDSITTGGESPSEAILSWEKSISDAITFSKNEAIKTLDLQLEIIRKQIGKTSPKDTEAVGELQRLLNDVTATRTALLKLNTSTLSAMNDMTNTYNEELKTKFETSVTKLKNYYDSMISGIEDSGKLIDDYASATDLQKIAIKDRLKISLSQADLSEEEINSLISGLDTDYTKTKEEFSKTSSEKISGFKESTNYKKALKSYQDIVAKSQGKVDASGESVLTSEEIAKTEKEFSDLFLDLVNLMNKGKTKLEKLADGFDLIGSAIGNLANVLGSETLGKIGSGISTLSSGLKAYESMGAGGFGNMFSSVAGFAGGLNAISAGISVAMMAGDLLGINKSKEEIEAYNNKSQEAWDTMISELSSINETLKDNFNSLIDYSQSLAENTTPTKTNLSSGQSQLQGIYDVLYNQERKFSDLMFSTTTSVSKGLFKGDETQKDNWTLGLQDVYSSLMNGDIQKATTEQLQSFSDMLENMSNEDLVKMYETLKDTTLSGYDFSNSNLDTLSDQIQNYVDILTRAYEQIEKFAKASTISDFVGMTYTDVDIIFEQLKEQYKSMGVEITSEVETALYDLAQKQVIKETITADVRDGFVDGWAQGQDSVEILSSSLQSYFSGIMSNISKVFYDNTMNDFNDTLSKFYTDYAEGLAKVKELGLSPIDFANSQDYSTILNSIANAENLENNMKTVFETIRKQAEEAGISGALIDNMLGDEYRISIRENTSSAISSGIMDGFNNGEISEATIKNSIFSTIVQQAMGDIIDNIMTKNGIDGIMTQIIDALSSGDTAILEQLGLTLNGAINVGLDEASGTIEYLMGLLDKYSGTNTKPIVFFDESNLDSIQQTMTDYENFSLSSNDNLPIIETTRRIEINITASGDLSDEALSKIAKEVASEAKVEVSTSKYI